MSTTEVREALDATGASAFIPKIIDPLLLEYQRRYAPAVRALPSVKWGSDQYYFNQRTQVANGGNVRDGGAVPVSTSTYLQNNFQMKHFQQVGAVTGYAQEVTRMVIGDLRETEIEGAIKGLYWDVETGLLWSNAASTLNGARPQIDGLDTLVSSYSGDGQNVIDEQGNSFTLAMLDELIDMVSLNAAEDVESSEWMFLASTTIQSKLSQLLVNQQRYTSVEVETGLVVPSYRNIPFVRSSFLSGRGFSMGTVTTTTDTSGGSLPATTTYKYTVTAVIARQGEIAPCAEVSQATGSGSSNIITLAFSTPTGLDGAQPILYKVYRTAGGGASNSETLLGWVDATVGLSADGVTPILTTSIIDTGTALVPQNGSTVPGTLPTQYFGTNAAVKPPAAGLERVYLISRNPNYVVRPYVRDAVPLDVYPTTTAPDQLPFAIVSDTCLALRASKFVGGLTRVASRL